MGAYDSTNKIAYSVNWLGGVWKLQSGASGPTPTLTPTAQPTNTPVPVTPTLIQPTPTPSPTPVSKTLVVYDDKEQNNFYYLEWQTPAGTKCLVTPSFTSQVASGKYALEANFNNFCTLFIIREKVIGQYQSLPFNNYNYVQFDIAAQTGKPILQGFNMQLVDAGYTTLGKAVNIISASNTKISNIRYSWQHVKIPLSAFGVTSSTFISGIRIRDDNWQDVGLGNTILDNIKFSTN